MIAYFVILGLTGLIVLSYFLSIKHIDVNLTDETVAETKENINKKEKRKFKKQDNLETLSVISLFLSILMIILTITSSIAIIVIQSPIMRDNILEEKALVVYKIDNNEYANDVEMIEDINDFNKKLHKAKKNRESLWFNWFTSRHYDDLTPIEYSIDIKTQNQGEISYDKK